MVRIFNVYYPVRTLVLVGGEALTVWTSFMVAALLRFGADSQILLPGNLGFYKILAVSALAVVTLHFFDLYDPQQLQSRADTSFRVLVMLGSVSLILSALAYLFPRLILGQGVYATGLCILTLALFGWLSIYAWLVQQPYFRERVYVLGAGERATRLVQTLRTRRELGMEIIGWAGAAGNGSLTRDSLAQSLLHLRAKGGVDRIILALADRRGTSPVRELLQLRLSGIHVEDATSILERISGRIEVDELHPSWLIFSEGFRLNPTFLVARRIISLVVSFVILLVCLPLLPLIALAIKFTSPGPVIYRQKRVGRNGETFHIYKFRTMRSDAEAETGATWATGDDPRVTSVGRFLRKTRLDEIPQLWNVFQGDMGFVGPRPERPEFVEMLTENIPYYHLRHIIRPGLTGWAQINYSYGASVEESKEKLKYDLYYIKNMSLLLDLLIVLQTVKSVLLRRGSR